jgi:hypothetical protein
MEYYNGSTGPQEEYKLNEVIFYQTMNLSIDYNKQEKEIFDTQSTTGDGFNGIEKILFMPRGDGTGPPSGAGGPRDGSKRGGGRAGGKGTGSKTGGGKGGCK